MPSNKEKLNSLRKKYATRVLSEEEEIRLKKALLKCFADVQRVCDKYNLSIMLGGGSCLGAIRHRGFIPWDDDLDVNMPREDFEKLKLVFDGELGDKYELNAPNYSKKSLSRFPKILVKNTKFVELGMSINDPKAMIKIDLFTAENIPDNPFIKNFKGMFCNLLMGIAGAVSAYESYQLVRNEGLYRENEELRNSGKQKRIIGFFFSLFGNRQVWFNRIDRHIQYGKESKHIGFPTGRRHYFGEIHEVFSVLPLSEAQFENLKVNVPGDADAYLRKLYGDDYMQIPPEKEREGHFVVDIVFDENVIDVM